jgi:hypothetical protein
MNLSIILGLLVKEATKYIAQALIAIAQALIATLWKTYKNPIVLGAAIVGFSGGGLAMVIGSRAVTGWNQAALLGFGTSLLIVGTVELGVLGVLNRIIDPNPTKELIEDLNENLAQRFATLENWLDMPTFQRAEFGGHGKLRPGHLDDGSADDDGGQSQTALP